MLKEAKKVAPLADIFNDLNTYVALTAPLYLYDEVMSTKFTVNF